MTCFHSPASGRVRGTGNHHGGSYCPMREMSLPTLLDKIQSLALCFSAANLPWEANPHRCVGQRRWKGTFPPLSCLPAGSPYQSSCSKGISLQGSWQGTGLIGPLHA